jgi:hypothetical protein
MATTFYPSLATIIPVDSLPNELGFIKDGLTNLLSKVYYRNLQYSINERGDKGFYSLSIVSLTRIDFEIPGTGIFLILNPSHDIAVPDISEFPIVVNYDWPILGYLRQFDLANFSFAPGDFFDLALAILDVSERQLLDRVLTVFIDSPTPINTFVDDINALHGTSIPHPVSGDPTGEVLAAIDATSGLDDAGKLMFAAYILDSLSQGGTLDRLKTFFDSFYGGDVVEYIKKMLIPKIEATLDVSMAVEFPRNILQPLTAVGGTVIADPNVRSRILFDPGDFYFSTERGIGFDTAISASLNPSQIGSTGLGISITGAKLDISRTENIPEADADGRPADFVGVYIEEATISFPQFWNHDSPGSTGVIFGRDLIIGTGGFSGTVGLEGKLAGEAAPLIKLKFGDDFQVSLDRFSITLKQNEIIGSDIQGTLRVPGVKDANGAPADIRIKVHIHKNGDFDVTVYEDDGFPELRVGNIFSITVNGLYFGKKDDDFYFGTSGCIKFLEPTIAGFLKGDFCVEKLLIWSDGRIEIEGGTIPLPDGVSINIGPVEIYITAIHFGSHQQEHNGVMRKYRYFGFDGGVNINPGGVDARGDGIKFYYSVDDGPGKPAHRFLRIQSIAIDLIIPGDASKETATALISGYLAIKETGTGTEYSGGVKFSLPKAQIAGGASMKMKPDEPAFIIDAFVEFAVPLPLGATGLGIYGFRGLIGHRYVATKNAAGLTDDNSWFDYYKAKVPPVNAEGVGIEKFETPDETKNYDSAFSVGAGVSLATTPDGGKTFSMKLFLLVSIPELILLEGKANILGERVGLTSDDPPFFAYLAITPTSIETGFGADYKVPDSGDILSIYAEIQAGFFFNDSSAWYINLGTEEKRIEARIITLFNAWAYLMLSASGIKTAAGVDFGFKKKYAGGMVRASVGVYIEIGGRISFERPQVGGYAKLGGHVDVYLLFVGFFISIDTSLSVEAPKPFLVTGSVKLCVGINLFFTKIKKCFQVQFTWERDNVLDLDEVIPFNIEEVIERPPFIGVNRLSGESFKLKFFGTAEPAGGSNAFNDAVIPLDTWVDFEFKKGMNPNLISSFIGGVSNGATGTIDFIPPDPNVRQVEHVYSVQELEVKAWNGGAWVDYNPYEAMASPQALVGLNANPSNYKVGQWQKQGLEYNKIRLLGESIFSYMEQTDGVDPIPENFGVTSATLFCETQIRDKNCVDWMNVDKGHVYPADIFWQQSAMLFQIFNEDGTVINFASHFGIPKSLAFPSTGIFHARFSKPCAELELKMTSFSGGAEIRFYRLVNPLGTSTYELIEARQYTSYELLSPVLYNDPDDPVRQIIVDPYNTDEDSIMKLCLQIEALWRKYYEDREQNQGILEQIKKLVAAKELRECDPVDFSRKALIKYLKELKKLHEKCRVRLGRAEREAKEICTQYEEFDARFKECFPHAPCPLSYEIYQEIDLDGIDEFRFRIWNDTEGKIILSSSANYTSTDEAKAEMFIALEALNDEKGFEKKTSEDKRYYYNIVDSTGEVVARRIEYFGTSRERNNSIAELQKIIADAIILDQIVIDPRDPDCIPCPVCLDHLDCWTEMARGKVDGRTGPSFDRLLDSAVTHATDDIQVTNANADAELINLDFTNINTDAEFVNIDFGATATPLIPIIPIGCLDIIKQIQKASDKFCKEYEELYRELYACNYHILITLRTKCEKVTEIVEQISEDCEKIDELIHWLTILLEEFGGLKPPKGFECGTLIHSVCCLSLEDYNFNINIPGQAAIEADFGATQEAIERMLAPIWRPDTKYYVRMKLRDRVQNSVNHDNNYYFGFRTAGPVGHFHEDNNADYVTPGDNPDEYKLTNIRSYINYKRSYPNTDGRLINSKPLFYEDARILMFYNERYTYHMFSDWPLYNGLPAINGNRIQVVVIDPKEEAGVENPPPPHITNTTIPQAVVSWPTDDDPRIPQGIRTLMNLRNPELLNPDFVGGDCWLSGGDMIQPASVYTHIELQYLKPLKLYTAVFNNIYDGDTREVHRYVFQTSRYADFPAQVQSYLLDDGTGNTAEAIFQVEHVISNADINLGYEIVTDNLTAANSALATTFADQFERTILGAWEMPSMQPAVTTEFNVLRQEGTGKVFGILIRNPESFNDPKTPIAEILPTVAVLNGIYPDPNYKVLFSKDRSQVLVMNTAKNITAPSLRFRFQYIEWDGEDYVARSVVITSSISLA